jgi:hypothetical protein
MGKKKRVKLKFTHPLYWKWRQQMLKIPKDNRWDMRRTGDVAQQAVFAWWISQDDKTREDVDKLEEKVKQAMGTKTLNGLYDVIDVPKPLD